MVDPISVNLDEIGKKVFGNSYEKIKEWCVKRENPNKYNAIPKGKVANVFVVIEPVSRLIIRHEQETLDLTTVPTYLGFSVPAILNTKLQSGAIRRQMLSLLHEWFDRNKETANKELKVDNYTCIMRPYTKQAKERLSPESFEGYCGKCPNCLIFGYAVQEGAGYNVKSRVEGDLYVGLVPEEKGTITVTFNAIHDVTKTPYDPRASEETRRTGALYEFKTVEAGIPFIGKLALKDVTLAELLLILITIARTTRVGGRVTHFGEIKIHIPAILFNTYELGSGYEAAHKVLAKTDGKKIPTLEEVINELTEYVGQFQGNILVLDRELAGKIRKLKQSEVDAIVLQAWKDALLLKASLDCYVEEKKEGCTPK